MDQYIGIKDGEEFVRKNLAGLSERKKQLQNDIDATDILINDVERDFVDKGFISSVFSNFDEIYKDDTKPYQRRDLLYRTLRKIEISDKLLKVGIPLKSSDSVNDIRHESPVGIVHNNASPHQL